MTRRAVSAAVGLALLALPSAAAAERPTTPQLIQAAQSKGEISGTRATQLRAYALAAPRKLPSRYRSSTPWDGTLTLRRIHGALPKLPRSPARTEAAALAGPSAAAATSCDTDSVGNLPNSLDSTHFHIEYGTLAPGLTISQYRDSLETTWGTEITSYGWAAPPLMSAYPGRYYVRLDSLSSGLYGYVSASGTDAGFYGNNPNTAWNEGDAYSTCMVLNRDYSGFPSSPQNSLDSTTAHEFNHSIQYGYGALTGSNAASDSFTEAGATWMEDEVYDSSNDNYNYLWPDFKQGLANYDPSYPYPDWIALRGITEPFGTNGTGLGENVMQDFWERTSKNEAGNLTSMEAAVADQGGNLPTAYENYAIAVKFSKQCGAGNGSAPPDCFEEGNGYAAAAGGRPASNQTITTVPGSATDTVTDGYAIEWTALPTTGGPYSVRVKNTATGGTFKSSVACDPGAGSPLTIQPVGAAITAGQTATLRSFNPAGCSAPVVVTTNSAHSTANPASPAARAMQVQTLPLRTLSVSKAGTGTGTVTSSPAGISCGGDCNEAYTDGDTVTLSASPASGSTFTGWGGACSGTGSCTVTMTAAKSVTANFQSSSSSSQHSLLVSEGGGGSGSVTSNPAGISCPSTCSHDFSGEQVSLTPSADPGSSFTGWSGDCSGSGACSVTTDQDHAVTATFQPDQTLTVTKSGAGNVASSPAGIDCGSTSSHAYSYGQSVALSAAPASGYTFTGWSGDCTGTGACNVSMDAARNVAAGFAPLPAGQQPAGSGTSQTIAPALDLPPALSTPALSLTRFRSATRVSYRLSEAARVGFQVQRRVGGHWRKVGSFTKSGKAGANRFRFSRRFRGRNLRPGLYRFVVYARDATGHRSATRRKSFRILTP